jgi:hypothetical protein
MKRRKKTTAMIQMNERRKEDELFPEKEDNHMCLHHEFRGLLAPHPVVGHQRVEGADVLPS